MTNIFRNIFKKKFNLSEQYPILPDAQYVVKFNKEKYLYNSHVIIEFKIAYGNNKDMIIPFFSDNKIAKKITRTNSCNFIDLLSKFGDIQAESLFNQMLIANDGLILVNYLNGKIKDAVASDYNNDSVYRFLQKKGHISLEELREKLK